MPLPTLIATVLGTPLAQTLAPDEPVLQQALVVGLLVIALGALALFVQQRRTLHRRAVELEAANEQLRREVAERRQAEDSLHKLERQRREALELLQLQIERMPLAYLLSGPDMRYIHWNAAAEHIFGWRRDETLGKHPFDLIVPPPSQPLVADIFKRLQAGDMNAHASYQNLTKTGQLIWCEWHNTPLVTTSGKFVGLLSMAQDITQRRHADEALRVSEQRNRLLIETARDVIFTLDTEGLFTLASPSAVSLAGWHPEETVGRHFVEFMHPDEVPLLKELFRRTLAGENIPTMEARVRMKSGEYVSIEYSSTALVQDGRTTGILGIARDISERKRLEEQFRQAQKLEAIGRLAGGVAHDFNNLLTVIIGYCELLVELLPADQQCQPYLTEIHRSADRAATLTRQLLAFGRKQMVEPVVLDLGAVVTNVEQMLRRLIGDDVVLAVELAPDLWPVKADPGQIEQVLMNLAVNARDAMPHGGKLTMETANVHRTTPSGQAGDQIPAGDYVCLTVRDTGVGMDNKIRVRIFEPFFTTKEVGKGTGLGLATVYGIVRQAQGTVEVESEPGRGAIFRVLLPRLAPPPAVAATDGLSLEGPTGTETVLLVDDDASVRRLAVQILHKNGYTVLEAHDAVEALRLSDQHSGPIHIVMTDVIMPAMSGHHLVEQLTQLRPKTRCLFMSAHVDEALKREGPAVDNSAFLRKPFSAANLARKVREVLDR
jgi:two-component system cell cycle sensor histidine kinase/response regulator CckA